MISRRSDPPRWRENSIHNLACRIFPCGLDPFGSALCANECASFIVISNQWSYHQQGMKEPESNSISGRNWMNLYLDATSSSHPHPLFFCHRSGRKWAGSQWARLQLEGRHRLAMHAQSVAQSHFESFACSCLEEKHTGTASSGSFFNRRRTCKPCKILRHVIPFNFFWSVCVSIVCTKFTYCTCICIVKCNEEVTARLRAYSCMYAYSRIMKHTNPHIHTYVHTYMQKHTRYYNMAYYHGTVSTRMLVCMHTCMHVCNHELRTEKTYTHARAHTHTHTHTHTYTHVYKPKLRIPQDWHAYIT